MAPVILSSLTEVEERSLALEVRAFGRPGRRHFLWWAAGPPVGARPALGPGVAFVAVVALRIAGRFPAIP